MRNGFKELAIKGVAVAIGISLISACAPKPEEQSAAPTSALTSEPTATLVQPSATPLPSPEVTKTTVAPIAEAAPSATPAATVVEVQPTVAPTAIADESLIGPDRKVKAVRQLVIKTDDRGDTREWGAIPKDKHGVLQTGVVKDADFPWYKAPQGAFSGIVAGEITDGQVPLVMDSSSGPIHVNVDLTGVPENPWVPGWACLGVPGGDWSNMNSQYVAPNGKLMKNGQLFFTCKLDQVKTYLKKGDQVGFIILGAGISIPSDASADITAFYKYLDENFGPKNTSLISGKSVIRDKDTIHYVGQILFPFPLVQQK